MKKLDKNTLETEQAKLDKDFRIALYRIDNLSFESHALADLIKDYIDKKLELMLKTRDNEKT